MKSDSKMLLQNMQDAYSTYLKMALYMTDDEGHPITNLSGMNPFVELLVYQTNVPFLNQLRKLIEQHSVEKECVVINPLSSPLYSRIKALLIPVVSQGKIRSYIWCWSYIEKGISVSEKKTYGLPILSNEKIQHTKECLQKMADICAKLLMTTNEDEQLNEVEKLVDNLKSKNVSYESILKTTKSKMLDYVGIATLSDDNFKIKSYLGPNKDHIQGELFKKSGTFFAEAEESKCFEYWEYVGIDPRLSFFLKKEVETTAFFCYPVFINDQVTAFVFGGKTKESTFCANTLQSVRIVGKIIELSMNTEAVKSSLDLHLMKLSILMEISKSISTIYNLQDLLLLITHLANSLVPSNFTCVNTMSSYYEFLNVNNKISDQMIEEYCNHIRDDLNSRRGKSVSQTARMIEKYNTVILECPIYINDKLYAILSVSLQRPKELKEAEAYLSSLAGISAIAFKTLLHDLQHQITSTVIDIEPLLTNKVIEQLTTRELDVLKLVVQGHNNKTIADALFISPHTVKNHITNIFTKLGVKDRTQIIASFYHFNLGH